MWGYHSDPWTVPVVLCICEAVVIFYTSPCVDYALGTY
jgi:hypothetical protein